MAKALIWTKHGWFRSYSITNAEYWGWSFVRKVWIMFSCWYLVVFHNKIYFAYFSCSFKHKRSKLNAFVAAKCHWSYLTTLQSLQVTWSWNMSRHSTLSMSWRGTCRGKQKEHKRCNTDGHVQISILGVPTQNKAKWSSTVVEQDGWKVPR